MKGTVTTLASMVLIGVSSAAFALDSALKNRLEKDPVIHNTEYHQAIDIKEVSKDWLTNPARAQIKYNRPNLYRGKLKRIFALDINYDLVFDAGNGNEIQARLFPYQLGPWVQKDSGKWKPEGGLKAIEFVALYDPGQEFVLSCGYTLPGQLMNCLAFPSEAVK